MRRHLPEERPDLLRSVHQAPGSGARPVPPALRRVPVRRTFGKPGRRVRRPDRAAAVDLPQAVMKSPADVLEIFLQAGEFYFGGEKTRIRTLLGSCVAITVWHPKLRIGGMSHYMLPRSEERRVGKECGSGEAAGA